MKPLKMNWAQTPYVRNDSCGWDAKLAFDCFVPKELFEIVKPAFEGYIQKNQKKVALYNLSVVDSLIKNGHKIELDGISVEKTDNNLTEYLLSISETSTNDKVSYLAQFWNRMTKHKQQREEFKNKLDNYFGNRGFRELSPGVEIPKDAKWETFTIGSQEYTFEFKYGVEQATTWEERSHEYFVPVSIYRKIPSKGDLPELKKFLEESKELGKKPNPDANPEWQPGFDANTFEPKKKMGYKR